MIQKRVQEHYDEAISLGFEVVGVWLQGSQNYNCDIYTNEYQSDVDTKCIILPNLNDVIKGTSPRSYTHIRENNEHIDIKDIRVMFEMFKKQNSAYIEILFSKYFVINPKYKELVAELISNRVQISRINPNQFLRCLTGTSLEKYKALEHPFPTVADKLEKFGYDPKQLHHILRLYDLIKKYIEGRPFEECMVPDDPDYLIKVKTGQVFNLEEARQVAKDTDAKIKKLKEEYSTSMDQIDYSTLSILDSIKLKFISKFFKEELSKE